MNKRTIVIALGAILALTAAVSLLGMSLSRMASATTGCINSLTASTFEIDPEANLVENVAACSDWLAPPGPVEAKADLATGQGDDSFGQGTAEDNPNPTIVNGSIPNNKSDLKAFGVTEEDSATGDPIAVNLFWTRVQEPNGTTNMDFELNQTRCLGNAATCANNGTKTANYVTPIRTGNGEATPGADDVLISYDLAKGGSVPTISIRFWTGTQWGTPHVISGSGTADAVGSINNTTTVPAATLDGVNLGELGPDTFGEASVSFDALFGNNACAEFGSVYVKSRSSDSFPAEVKDFIAPLGVDLGDCPAELATSASADVAVGGQLTDSATLTTQAGADGTITFRLYGPFATAPTSDAPCTTPIASATQTRAVTNHNEVGGTTNPYTTPTPYTATAPGFYEWTAQFDAAANSGVASVPETPCGTAAEQIQVANAPSTISTTQSWVPKDTATVSNTGGTVTFTLLKGATEQECLGTPPAGSVVYTSNALTVTDTTAPIQVSTTDDVAANQPPAVNALTPAASETYRWKAVYSGIQGVDGSTSCTETTAININNG